MGWIEEALCKSAPAPYPTSLPRYLNYSSLSGLLPAKVLPMQDLSTHTTLVRPQADKDQRQQGSIAMADKIDGQQVSIGVTDKNEI